MYYESELCWWVERVYRVSRGWEVERVCVQGSIRGCVRGSIRGCVCKGVSEDVCKGASEDVCVREYQRMYV